MPREIIRKRHIVVRVPVSKAGQVTLDKRHVPASALAVTGIGVFAQSKGAPPVLPVFLHGAGATQPTGGAWTPGVLTLNPGGGATASFSQSAAAGQFIYYAYPIGLKAPLFQYLSFSGGFIDVGTMYETAVIGGKAQSVAFRVWRSVTPNLGNDVALTVTHP